MRTAPAGGDQPEEIAAIVARELAALASDAQALAARLTPGDVVSAVVLPSNGLTDLLDIGGLRVAAELPPTLLPGEAVTVLVTGFERDRINLQIVRAPPDAPPAGDNARPAIVSAASPAIRAAPAPVPAQLANAPAATRALPAAASAAAWPAASAAAWSAALPRPTEGSKIIEAQLAAAQVMAAPAARPAGPVAAAARPAGPPFAAVRPDIALRSAITALVPPPAARGPAAFTEPAALLRALHLPVTATNVAAARLALESPQRLPNALAMLERALANDTDPRLATLRTLTSFLARLDPRSPVFGAQVEAFADHLVTGREVKLARLAQPPADPDEAPAVAERAAVIRTGLDYDLKTQLLTLAADHASSPSAASPRGPGLDRAIAGALTAITALQLNAAAALSNHPGGLEFALPIALPDGFAQARVRIARDAPDGRETAPDGDNFHIVFVLETRHLGTIAIDVMTTGRAVCLSVKTEAAPAQRAFTTVLGRLTERLETLRYRVVRADAAVAAPLEPKPAATDRPPPVEPRLLDIDA